MKQGDIVIIPYTDGERIYGKIVAISGREITVDVDCGVDSEELLTVDIFVLGLRLRRCPWRCLAIPRRLLASADVALATIGVVSMTPGIAFMLFLLLFGALCWWMDRGAA